MNIKNFQSFNNIIVPTCSDAISLKYHYPEFDPSLNAQTNNKIISLTSIIYDRTTNLLPPKQLDKNTQEKLAQYSNPVFIGFKDNLYSTNQQLQEYGPIFFFDDHTLKTEKIHTHYHTYSEYILSQPIQTIIGSDVFFNEKFSCILNLSQTLLGSILYHSAQYMFYQNKNFLNYIPSKYMQLKTEKHWNEISYYMQALTPEVFFTNHINSLPSELFIISPEILSKDFILFYQKTISDNVHLNNYLSLLFNFLKQQIFLNHKPNTHFIQPISTLRFMNNDHIILENVLLNTQKVNKQIDIKPNNSCRYVYSASAFLSKIKKVASLEEFYHEPDDISIINPNKINYTQALLSLIYDNSEDIFKSKTINPIDKCIIINKFKALQEQFKICYEESMDEKNESKNQSIVSYDFKKIYTQTKIGNVILQTTLNGFATLKNNKKILIVIYNNLPSLQELALQAYIYSQANNQEEISLIGFSPTGFKKLTFSQIKKQIDKIFQENLLN